MFSDYALRILLYLGAQEGVPETKMPSLIDISRAYGISFHHLSKVAHKLTQLGYVQTQRGRTGGLRLGRRPDEINIGGLLRETEPHFHLVECFDGETNTCPIVSACGLIRPLVEARQAFLSTLDRYTLADALGNRERLIPLWSLSRPAKVSSARGS
jgi:Rrf2 family nitric oxide-sensitive transcriptional repressor